MESVAREALIEDEIACAVLAEPPAAVLAFPARKSFSETSQHSPQSLKNVVLLGVLLMALQALDGMLTIMGVMRFGVQMEGNPFLRYLLIHSGPMPVIFLKVAAICLVGFVCAVAYRSRWISHVLVGLCCVYALLAVGPWSYILFVAPHVF